MYTFLYLRFNLWHKRNVLVYTNTNYTLTNSSQRWTLRWSRPPKLRENKSHEKEITTPYYILQNYKPDKKLKVIFIGHNCQRNCRKVREELWLSLYPNVNTPKKGLNYIHLQIIRIRQRSISLKKTKRRWRLVHHWEKHVHRNYGLTRKLSINDLSRLTPCLTVLTGQCNNQMGWKKRKNWWQKNVIRFPKRSKMNF